MNDAILTIIAVVTIIMIGTYFFWRNKRGPTSEQAAVINSLEIAHQNKEQMTTDQYSAHIMRIAETIQINSQFGESLSLSRSDSLATSKSKKYQEIVVRGDAIGASIVHGSMPYLASAQTLQEIAKAAPNGFFTATAPVSTYMKYQNGTFSSIVVQGKEIAVHAGFEKITLSPAINPAVAIAGAMQAMALVSGQYYMVKMSRHLDEIGHGIEKLVAFHHDANIGSLRSVDNRMRAIIGKNHLDETDIIALQSGIHEAESVLMEYTTRLERFCDTGEIGEIEIRSLLSRLSATKELKRLSASTDEHELYYSFQMCLLASKLMLENKKAEFLTRLKIGDTAKAMEVLGEFKSMRHHSFINNASGFLDAIYNPINAKAETLLERQWLDTKRAKGELELLETKRADMRRVIEVIANDCSNDDEMIRSFSEEIEILYLPSNDGAEPRVFISAKEKG